MATLYELTDAYLQALTLLETAETDEDLDAAWAEMDALEGDITDKAEMYARIIRNKLADAEMYKTEAERLAKARRAAERVAGELKARLMESMKAVGLSEIRTNIGKWRLQLNPPSCVITDRAAVPVEYLIPQPDEIDKTAILRHYKETGELLPGVDIVRAESLRFR